MITRTQIIRLATLVLPLEWSRAVYRWYCKAVAWWRYDDPNFPRIISFEVSSHCNRACSYCPVSRAKARGEHKFGLMDDETITAIIGRLKEIDWSGCVDFIFYSEPMLHPKLPEIVRRVKEACPKSMPRICTNGDLLTEANMRELIAAGLDRFYVMRHNPTPEGWRDRINILDQRFPGYMVLMDIDEVADTVGLHTYPGLPKPEKPKEWQRNQMGIATCEMHEHCAQIGINGDWLLCCVDFPRTLSFGNLKREGILEIWNKPEFVSLRTNLRKGVIELPACKQCIALNSTKK